MTYTVTLLTDHKGFSRSRVVGDEYVVDATINITSYDSAGNVGELISASDLGLSSVNCVLITGQESLDYLISSQVDGTTGEYASKSTFKILAFAPRNPPDGTNDEVADTTDIGMVRVRVYGSL